MIKKKLLTQGMRRYTHNEHIFLVFCFVDKLVELVPSHTLSNLTLGKFDQVGGVWLVSKLGKIFLTPRVIQIKNIARFS
jgi:hypothetical protein